MVAEAPAHRNGRSGDTSSAADALVVGTRQERDAFHGRLEARG